MVNLLYDSGLRISEWLRLRYQDIQLEYHQIIVRSGKGAKEPSGTPANYSPDIFPIRYKLQRYCEQIIKLGFVLA